MRRGENATPMKKNEATTSPSASSVSQWYPLSFIHMGATCRNESSQLIFNALEAAGEASETSHAGLVIAMPASSTSSTPSASSSSSRTSLASVVGVEIESAHVVGANYTSPLLSCPTLTLEINTCAARRFATLDALKAYYASRTVQTRMTKSTPSSSDGYAAAPEAATTPSAAVTTTTTTTATTTSTTSMTAFASPSSATKRSLTWRSASPRREEEFMSCTTIRLGLSAPGSVELVRSLMLNDRRLLRLCESGLPTWYVLSCSIHPCMNMPLYVSIRASSRRRMLERFVFTFACCRCSLCMCMCMCMCTCMALCDISLHLRAIFAGTTPLLAQKYRPWMRRCVDASVLTVSVLSLAIGFYDLYKRVPWVREAMLRASESFFGGWIRALTSQMRLSILLTFLLSKSPLLISTTLRAFAAFAVPILKLAAAIVVGVVKLVARLVSAGSTGGRFVCVSVCFCFGFGLVHLSVIHCAFVQ